ncbi:hypothetical protein T484DRAFT_1768412 [Baffinella frigidus]|nr:hypothetical protein T484DRAFT_1768412 [Cryptophyta sp. CCMP2293]
MAQILIALPATALQSKVSADDFLKRAPSGESVAASVTSVEGKTITRVSSTGSGAVLEPFMQGAAAHAIAERLAESCGNDAIEVLQAMDDKATLIARAQSMAADLVATLIARAQSMAADLVAKRERQRARWGGPSVCVEMHGWLSRPLGQESCWSRTARIIAYT